LVKKMKAKLEEAKISVRRVREDVKKRIENEEGVGEDDRRSELARLEETVKSYISRIEEQGQKKEDEVMTI